VRLQGRRALHGPQHLHDHLAQLAARRGNAEGAP
jgi:hypothetical protein